MTVRRLRVGSGRSLLGALALLLLVLFATGCGSDTVSKGSVASVNGDDITQGEFDHWRGTVAKSQSQPQPGQPPAATPDPPTFQRCVAGKAAQPLPKGAPKPNPAQLKAQCQRDNVQLNRQVLQFLINARWIQQEADDRSINVPDAQVRKSFDDQKRQAFPDDRKYQQFLAQSGQSEQDILYRLKLDLLVNEVQKKIVEGKGTVNNEQIKRFYDKNRAQFGKQTLPQATEQIRQTLRAQGEQQALRDFVGKFEKTHREQTVCTPQLLVSECKNGPKPPPQPPAGATGNGAPPPGATGSGGPPPGATGAPPSGGAPTGTPGRPPSGK